MKQPILFFAFANQADQPLPDLLEESMLIDEALSGLSSEGKFILHLDKHTSTADIIRKLGDFRNRVSIFHFAGHAGSAHLYLTDQSANGKGLAQLLGLQKHLRLVFLNGCNTSGFIRQLLDQGVPAVIATTREVDDAVALKLAGLFYNSLSKGASIRESFDFAKGAIESDDTIARQINRGLVLSTTPKVDFPWGMYYKDESAMDWNLDAALADVNPLPKYFWLRFSLIALPAALLYIWSLIHFGFENLTIYLTILGALAGIVFFLVKFYGSKFPGISHTLSNLRSFTLKPAVIAVVCLIVLGIIGLISSVRIHHPGSTPLAASLKTMTGIPVSHLNLHPGNPDRTTLLAVINPFIRNHKLEIEGYEPFEVHYDLFTGASIQNGMLISSPAILVRLPHQRFIQKSRLRLKVTCNDKLYHYIPAGLMPSVMLGNQKMKIEENIYAEWSENLSFEESEIRDQAIQFWLDPHLNDTLKPLHIGDRIKIELLTKQDSVLVTKHLTVTNKNMTDVLLQ